MANRQFWPPTNAIWADGWQRVGVGGSSPAFGNNTGGVWAADDLPVAYALDPHGVLRMRGAAKLTYGTGTPPTMFTLPAGLRPGADGMWPCLGFDTANWLTLRVTVTALGVVSVRQMAGAGTDLNFSVFHLWLNPISFMVEQ